MINLFSLSLSLKKCGEVYLKVQLVCCCPKSVQYILFCKSLLYRPWFFLVLKMILPLMIHVNILICNLPPKHQHTKVLGANLAHRFFLHAEWAVLLEITQRAHKIPAVTSSLYRVLNRVIHVYQLDGSFCPSPRWNVFLSQNCSNTPLKRLL